MSITPGRLKPREVLIALILPVSMRDISGMVGIVGGRIIAGGVKGSLSFGARVIGGRLSAERAGLITGGMAVSARQIDSLWLGAGIVGGVKVSPSLGAEIVDGRESAERAGLITGMMVLACQPGSFSFGARVVDGCESAERAGLITGGVTVSARQIDSLWLGAGIVGGVKVSPSLGAEIVDGRESAERAGLITGGVTVSARQIDSLWLGPVLISMTRLAFIQ